MKSKVFKFVLPAFAFALAIVASFAFTPAQNGAEAADMPIIGYVQNGSTTSCLQVQETCSLQGAQFCTTLTPQQVNGVNIPVGTQIFNKSGTQCTTALRRAF